MNSKTSFTDRFQCMKRKALFQQPFVQIDRFTLNVEAGEDILSRMRRMEDQYRFLVGDIALHGAGGADLRRGSAGRTTIIEFSAPSAHAPIAEWFSLVIPSALSISTLASEIFLCRSP